LYLVCETVIITRHVKPQAERAVKHVLITDARELAALGAARSLGRAGHHVTLVDINDIGDIGDPAGPAGLAARIDRDSLFTASRGSRYVSAVRAAPDPWAAQGAYRRWLADEVRRGGYDAVLPISEASVVAAAALRPSLPQVRWLIPGDEPLRCALSKHHATRAAQAAGLLTPPTAFFDFGDFGDKDRAADPGTDLSRIAGLRYPLIVKTDNQELPDGRYRKGSAARADHPDEAAALLAEGRARGARLIVQELVPGHGAGVFLLRHGGRTLLRFAHRRLHEVPYTGGYSSLRESCHDEPLLAQAEALLASIGYEGVAMVEFRRTQDGRAYFLEINGRLWGSLALALHAGVDFPAALLSCMTGAPPDAPPADYPDGVRCRNVLPGEIRYLGSVLRAPREDHPPGRLRTAIEFVALSVDPSVRHDHLWRDDPGPAVIQAAGVGAVTLARAARALGHRALRAQERVLLARARRRAQGLLASLRGDDEATLLFLCYGNICRSPFAARYWNRRLGELGLAGPRAISAGLHEKEGRQTPARYQVLARALGVELADHRSLRLRPEAARQAGAIFVMDGANLRGLDPRDRDKAIPLGMFARRPGQSIEIADPYDLPLAAARRSYEHLVAALEGLLQGFIR
jgi:protein-tyrosine-phosphatase/biotin carboxylase